VVKSGDDAEEAVGDSGLSGAGVPQAADAGGRRELNAMHGLRPYLSSPGRNPGAAAGPGENARVKVARRAIVREFPFVRGSGFVPGFAEGKMAVGAEHSA
jgi:hypothetical protein